MQDMQRGSNSTRASILPLQMQRQHKVRPPRLSYGMVGTFAKEALRAVQDTISIHKAIRPEYAADVTFTCLHKTSRSSYPEEYRNMDENVPRHGRLARWTPLDDETYMGSFVLVCRRRMVFQALSIQPQYPRTTAKLIGSTCGE